jgi:hypothetical protein
MFLDRAPHKTFANLGRVEPSIGLFDMSLMKPHVTCTARSRRRSPRATYAVHFARTFAEVFAT